MSKKKKKSKDVTVKNMREIRKITGKNKFKAFIAYSEESVVKQ